MGDAGREQDLAWWSLPQGVSLPCFGTMMIERTWQARRMTTELRPGSKAPGTLRPVPQMKCVADFDFWAPAISHADVQDGALESSPWSQCSLATRRHPP